MDKSEMALAAAEDNAVAIRAIKSSLKSCGVRCAVRIGTTEKNATAFGNITTIGDGAVIAAFDGDSTELLFCDKTIAVGTSPILSVLPAGSGELRFSGRRSNARVVVIGVQ